VITSIGTEHLEFFGSLEAVTREEASLLPYIMPHGVVVSFGRWHCLPIGELPAPLLSHRPPSVMSIRLGQSRDCDLTAAFNGVEIQLPQRFDVLERSASSSDRAGRPIMHVRLRLLGHHNIANALAAIAIGRWKGVSDDAIAAALAAVRPVPGRMEPIRIGSADE